MGLHESVNSVGVVIGIALGGAGLWLQLAPKESELTFSQSLLQTENIVQFRRDVRHPDHVLFGPVTWQLIVNNDSERPVSINSMDIPTLVEGNDRISLPDIMGNLQLQDGAPLSFPYIIPALESRAILVEGYLPMGKMTDSARECRQASLATNAFMQCMIRDGVDAFGNQLDVLKVDGRFIGATFPLDGKQPSLEVSFLTSDSQRFATELRVMPIGY